MRIQKTTSIGASAAPSLKASSPRRLLRFQMSEIRLHWAIAGPFLVCYLSALILFVFYNPEPLRPGRQIFSWIHRISGVCLLVLPTSVLLRSRTQWKLHIQNIKQAWIWSLNDLIWLSRVGLAAISRKISLPEQGKFNAGEKLNFMMVMTTYPLFILTGVMIWLPGIAYHSWLVHFLMAVIATPLMVGHIVMATINPSTRKGLQGMISGFVDREWAKHHYRRWFRENFEAGRPPQEGPRAAVHTPEEGAGIKADQKSAPPGAREKRPAGGDGRLQPSVVVRRRRLRRELPQAGRRGQEKGKGAGDGASS